MILNKYLVSVVINLLTSGLLGTLRGSPALGHMLLESHQTEGNGSLCERFGEAHTATASFAMSRVTSGTGSGCHL